MAPGEYDFHPPVKLINDQADVEKFIHSRAKEDLDSLISMISQTVAGHEIRAEPRNPAAAKIVSILRGLETQAEQTQLSEESQRFGNTAIRIWSAKMRASAPEQFHEIAPGNPGWIELDYYFTESFGSPQRIDYGTGHELSFLAFVGGLFLTGVIERPDGPDILGIFAAYYHLVERLIMKFNLEPAGSHGVWGLDDNFHLEYIFGSAQLAYGTDIGIRPKDVLDAHMIDEMAPKNLYFNAIKFLRSMKRGNFFEHSPMLYDISAVPSWTKVHRGLVKMYYDEVFKKFPVVQHLWFGSLYSLEPAATSMKEHTIPMPTARPPH